MAYTKTPTVSTYQTKRVPMLFENESRAWNNNDTLAQNVLFELYKGEQTGDGYFETIKRPGIVPVTVMPLPAPVMKGVYYSNALECLVWCYEDNIMVIKGSSSTLYTIPGFSVTDQRIGFTEFLFQDGSVEIIITDGTTLVRINPITLAITYTAGTPVNVGQHRPYPIFLDGYLFLADEKGNIWNSNLNDPLVFSPSNFLTAEAYPDTIYVLARVDNYIVAMGGMSIEYFYDAANLNGSPLARYDSGSKPVGIVGSPAVVGNTIFFVGAFPTESPAFFSLENFKLTRLSNPSLERKLAIYPTAVSRLACNPLSLSGHTVVGISEWLALGEPIVEAKREMQIYDLTSGLWTTFTYQFIPSAGPIKQTAIMPLYTSDPDVISFSTVFMLAWQVDLYGFSSDVYTDLGVPIAMACRTRPRDFDTSRTKFMSRALFVGDQSGIPNDTLELALYFDDRTTVAGYYPLQVATAYPVAYTAGMFRNISFQLVYNGEGPMRFKYLEIDYNQGDN